RLASVPRDHLTITLSYRPPLDWASTLDYYRRHRLVGLETVEGDALSRVFKIGDATGWLRVRPVAGKAALALELALADKRHLLGVVRRVRRMLDLDSDPLLVAEAFARCPKLAAAMARHPGLRLARGFDPFETAVA